MRLSKIARESVPVVLVVLFYLVGVWIGKHPLVFSKYIHLTQSEVIVFVADPEMVPISLQTIVSAKAQMKVIFETDPEKISSSDLWLSEYAALASREILADQKELKDWDKLFELVSPDFRLSLFQNKQFLPLLWRNDKGSIHVAGLRFATDTKASRRDLLALEQVFLAESFHEAWLKRTDWNTTLLKLDDSSVPEARRASALRKIPLQEVHWVF
jgi:hypothetical protein